MTRRKFTMIAGATALAGWQVNPSQARPASISLVLAPSNLGLRPTESGGQPGTWRAPQALLDAGLAHALDAGETVPLERPTYEFEAQAGTRIRNGLSIRAFSLQLSEKVRDILKRNRFPVVIGGDCSILLGSLHGMRRAGGEDSCTSTDTAISSTPETTTLQSVWARQQEWTWLLRVAEVSCC